MTWALAFFLLVSLALAGALPLSHAPARGKVKGALLLCLALAWIALGISLAQIAARTASTLAAPPSAHRSRLIEGAEHEALTLLFALGGPLLLVSALGWFAHRATRAPPEARPPRRRRARIAQARAGRELLEARALIEEGLRAAGLDPTSGDLAQELATLPGEYAPPRGRLLLARTGKAAAGCVALHGLDGGTAEMRRLYVRPPFRGRGIGRTLAEAAIAEAARLGYARIRLDTPRSLREASALYRSLGFFEIAAYRAHDPGELFLERTLS